MIKTAFNRKSAKQVLSLLAACIVAGSMMAPPLRATTPPTDGDPNVIALNAKLLANNPSIPTINLFNCSASQLNLAIQNLIQTDTTINAGNAVSYMQTIATARGSFASGAVTSMIKYLGAPNVALADDLAAAAAAIAPKYSAALATAAVKQALLTGASTAPASDIANAMAAVAPSYAPLIAKSAIAAIKASGDLVEASEILSSVMTTAGTSASPGVVAQAIKGNTTAISQLASTVAAVQPGYAYADLSAMLASTGTKGGTTAAIKAAISASAMTATQQSLANKAVDVTDAIKTNPAGAVAAITAALAPVLTDDEIIAVVQGASYASTAKAPTAVSQGVTKSPTAAVGIVNGATLAAPTLAAKNATEAIKIAAVVSSGLYDDVAAAAANASNLKSGDVVRDMLKLKSGTSYILSDAQKKDTINAVLGAVPTYSHLLGTAIAQAGPTDTVRIDLGNAALQTAQATPGASVASVAAGMFKTTKTLRTGSNVTSIIGTITGQAAADIQTARNTVETIMVTDIDKKPQAQLAALMAGSAADRLAVAQSALLTVSWADGLATMATAIGNDAAAGGGNAAAIYAAAQKVFYTKSWNVSQAYEMASEVVSAGGSAAADGVIQTLVYNRARVSDNTALAGDLTTAAIGPVWQRANEIVAGAVSGQPKQGKAVIAAAFRNTFINQREVNGQYTGPANNYTLASDGLTTVTDHQALVAASLVGTAIKSMQDAIPDTGSFAATELAQVKGITSGAVKEALRELKITTVNGVEGQQVRGATAGAILGIDTTVGTGVQNILVAIATEAGKAAKIYGKDIANAFGVVLGVRNDYGTHTPGSMSDYMGVVLQALNVAVNGASATPATFTLLEAAFNSGLSLASSQVGTAGSLAKFVADHSSGSAPVGLPVTDISGL